MSEDSKTMLLKPAEVMAELKISRTTLWKLLGVARPDETPEIESFLIAPNARRIPRSELEAYVARKLASASPADHPGSAAA